MGRLNTIADGMSALKNAADGGKPGVLIEPAGKLLGAMFRIMQESGYISGFEYLDDGRGGQFLVQPEWQDQQVRSNITPLFGTVE